MTVRFPAVLHVVNERQFLDLFASILNDRNWGALQSFCDGLSSVRQL
jgi:hypothetical protein